jgi:hypothetical protein|tara:strand:- start:442 stop:603 length:162 start_codon:yes stop_codon:yes gene_type:complete
MFIFSLKAQAHEDPFLGQSLAHDIVHTVLFFLLITVTVTGIKWLIKKSKAFKH